MSRRFWLGRTPPLRGVGLLAVGWLSAEPRAVLAETSAAGIVRGKQQAVLEGQPSDRQAVVFVRARQEGYTPAACSGTLVAPNLVVTALHCVAEHIDGDYTCDLDGFVDESFGRDPADAGRLGAPYLPEGISVNTTSPVDTSQVAAVGKKVIAPQTESICRNDIAFVILDRDLDIEYVPLRVGKGLISGETVTVAGYGQSETAAADRNERSGLRLEGVGPSPFYEVKGQAPPGTFAVGQGPCPGDSGGPAISDETGELLGVFSFWSGSDCANPLVRAFYTQVAAFEPFLLQAFEEAGHLELVQPPEPTPVEPEPGTGGAGPEPEPAEGGEAGSAGGPGVEPEPEEAGGCGWSPVSASRSGWLWLSGLALAVAVARRPRARSP